MAERRMFAKTIIDSDSFLAMPMSAQALYFHLSMRADDEGFINSPKSIMRMIGASEDDMRLLIAKKFILPFDSGVVVIKHWRIHNYIQKDRFKPTVYTEEKAQLEFKENKAYTKKKQIPETIEISTENPMYTECIQSVYTGKDSIGKYRDSIEIDKYIDIVEFDSTPSPKVEEAHKQEREEIINYLNEICGTRYKATTKETVRLINGRLNEGYTVDDFKTVIYKKAKEWLHDSRMAQYLRPSTLFLPSKFEAYLNQQSPITKEQQNYVAMCEFMNNDNIKEGI